MASHIYVQKEAMFQSHSTTQCCDKIRPDSVIDLYFHEFTSAIFKSPKTAVTFKYIQSKHYYCAKLYIFIIIVLCKVTLGVQY